VVPGSASVPMAPSVRSGGTDGAIGTLLTRKEPHPYLIATGANVELINLDQPYSLYDTFYREWLRKERDRGTGGYHPASIRTTHTEIAHRLNEFKGEAVGLTRLLEGMALQDAKRLPSDTAFQGLLNIEEDELGDLAVSSFRHETLGEFLIARDILEGFGESVERLRRALRVTMTHDVNSFVRSGLRVVSQATVSRYFFNLSKKYNELLPTGHVEQSGDAPSTPSNAEKLRQQILYYIGRMPLDDFPEILRQAFRSESRSLLRRTAALGAMLHGDFVIERAYMAELDNPAEALLNRSIQMVNFGDVHADLYTFEDRGQDWSRTKGAVYERLGGATQRDIRLRWWDLKTLHSFYESRHYRDELTDREWQILKGIELTDPSSPERSVELRCEYDKLLHDLSVAAKPKGPP
jgi:hypothetical protein